MKTTWDNNEIQFARLLCEIRANIQGSDKEWQELYASMDLSANDVTVLFDRALVVWEKSKSPVVQENRKRDVYLKTLENGVVFIPQGWCDEFEQDPNEEAEVMTYAPVNLGVNSPIDTLYIPIRLLDAMQIITEIEARQLHSTLFETLARINAGENVVLG